MLKIGTLLDDKYKVMKDIGQGRWGRVYQAENLKLGNYWAIKEISLIEESPVNLLAEPEILKKLNHPSLPRIVDFINTGDYLYIVEDYFEGRNLRDIINKRELCCEPVVIEWGRQLCEILIYLHGLKPHPIIYRDMKPGNIIIDNNNNVKLIDFGIARVNCGQESDSTFIGTIGYAAPEQYSLGKRSDERTDIYGFGVTLFHILTGANPNQFVQELPPLRQVNKTVSPMLEQIVARCTQPDPDQRYQNARELMVDLKNALDYKHEKPGSIMAAFKALLNKSNSKVVFVEKLIGTAIIKIGGTNRGAGCTHTAISLASFLVRRKFRVAIVEINENPVFYSFDTLKSEKTDDSFKVSGIDFYWQNIYNKDNILSEAIQAGYDFIIIDLGRLLVNCHEEGFKDVGNSCLEKNKWYNDLLHAHMNILVSGSAVWQMNDLMLHLSHEFFDNWKVVLTAPDQLFYARICNQLKRNIYFAQFSPDPFQPNEHQDVMFTEILENLLPRNTRKRKKLLFWNS